MAFAQCTSMELNPLPVAPLVLKCGLHLGHSLRKGVRRGRGRGKGIDEKGYRWEKLLSSSFCASFFWPF
jgi:hypothetical protein